MSHGKRDEALLGSNIMTGKQLHDMSASVRARLMNVAKLNKEAFDLVLVRFAMADVQLKSNNWLIEG